MSWYEHQADQHVLARAQGLHVLARTPGLPHVLAGAQGPHVWARARTPAGQQSWHETRLPAYLGTAWQEPQSWHLAARTRSMHDAWPECDRAKFVPTLAGVLCRGILASLVLCRDMLADVLTSGQPSVHAKTSWSSCQDMLASLLFVQERATTCSCQDMLVSLVLLPSLASLGTWKNSMVFVTCWPAWYAVRAKTCWPAWCTTRWPAWCSFQDMRRGVCARTHWPQPVLVPRDSASLLFVPRHAGQSGARQLANLMFEPRHAGQPGACAQCSCQRSARAKTFWCSCQDMRMSRHEHQTATCPGMTTRLAVFCQRTNISLASMSWRLVFPRHAASVRAKTCWRSCQDMRMSQHEHVWARAPGWLSSSSKSWIRHAAWCSWQASLSWHEHQTGQHVGRMSWHEHQAGRANTRLAACLWTKTGWPACLRQHKAPLTHAMLAMLLRSKCQDSSDQTCWPACSCQHMLAKTCWLASRAKIC